MRQRWSIGLLGIVLLANYASADVSIQPPSTATRLGVLSPPVTLAAGATGLTTLGPNLTSASTIVSTSNADEVLLIHPEVPGARHVNIRLVSVTALADINQAILAIDGATQVEIAQGVVTQGSGAPVTLENGDLSVAGTFRSAALTTPTLTLDIEIRTTPGGPLAQERWVIALSGQVPRDRGAP